MLIQYISPTDAVVRETHWLPVVGAQTINSFIQSSNEFEFTQPTFRGAGASFRTTTLTSTAMPPSASLHNNHTPEICLPASASLHNQIPEICLPRCYDGNGQRIDIETTFETCCLIGTENSTLFLDFRPLFPTLEICSFDKPNALLTTPTFTLRILKHLSNCRFGKVFSAVQLHFNSETLTYERREGDELVAVKMCMKKSLHLYDPNGNSECEESPIREMAILQYLQQFQDPHIIPLYELCENANIIFSIQKYCATDLFNVVVGNNIRIDEESPIVNLMLENPTSDVIRGVVSCLSTLRRALVAHGDLSPENILIDIRDGTHFPYVIDFGMAKYVVPMPTTTTTPSTPPSTTIDRSTLSASSTTPPSYQLFSRFHGKSYYLAPESSGGQLHDGFNADAWSLGSIMLMMLSGFQFNHLIDDYLYQMIRKGKLLDWVNNMSLQKEMLPLTPSALDFLKRVLIPTVPSMRLQPNEMLEHPFLTKTPRLLPSYVLLFRNVQTRRYMESQLVNMENVGPNELNHYHFKLNALVIEGKALQRTFAQESHHII